MNRHVVVVGAGFGGLSAACHLAARGVRVTVLEPRDVPGGKAGRLSVQGFSWDTGPTLLTMPDVIDRVLRLAGMRLRDEVDLVPLAPLCRYRFASGAVLDHDADPARTAEAIARISRRDAERWPAFCAHAQRLHDVLGEPYMHHPFAAKASFATRVARKGSAAVALSTSLDTLSGVASKWFVSPEMRALVSRFATYVGASPSEANGALAMIAHIEGRGDAVYPRGGIHAVAHAVAHASTHLGVSLRLGEAATRVERRTSDWVVKTTRHTELVADAVVLNVDPVFAAHRLLEPDAPWATTLRETERAARSLSGVAFLFGLRGRTSGLSLHNISFPARYEREFEDVMHERRMPEDPTVYIAATSHADPGAAPPDHEALFTLVNAPARTDLDWAVELPRVRERVLNALCRIDPTAASRVVIERVLDPRDFAKTGSLDGALYGVAPHGMFGPFRRPPQRVPRTRGLYLAGGATHPGGGVPMVTLSGRHAAALCLEDLGIRHGEWPSTRDGAEELAS